MFQSANESVVVTHVPNRLDDQETAKSDEGADEQQQRDEKFQDVKRLPRRVFKASAQCWISSSCSGPAMHATASARARRSRTSGKWNEAGRC